MSNFEVSKELQAALRAVMAEVNCGHPGYGWDTCKLEGLLALQQECLKAFNECAAASRATDEPGSKGLRQKKID